jgi:hypothetical protein
MAHWKRCIPSLPDGEEYLTIKGVGLAIWKKEVEITRDNCIFINFVFDMCVDLTSHYCHCWKGLIVNEYFHNQCCKQWGITNWMITLSCKVEKKNLGSHFRTHPRTRKGCALYVFFIDASNSLTLSLLLILCALHCSYLKCSQFSKINSIV